MMHRQMQQEDPKVEILEAFRMTDKQKKGTIQASELRAKLTMLGEKLTNKEGNYLMRLFMSIHSGEDIITELAEWCNSMSIKC